MMVKEAILLMECAPLVTICMPTYNNEEYVEEAILSILSQQYRNIQLIISDDGSSDNTRNIIEKYHVENPDKITLQLHDQNLGLDKNVESIYPLIKGDYVCWFAGDDIFLPNKILEQVRLMMLNPDCIYSFHSVDVISSNGKRLYNYNHPILGVKLYTKEISKKLLTNRCFICMNSVMINRKLANEVRHNINIGPCNDWLLAFELSMIGKVIYLPQILVAYRRHQNNVTRYTCLENEEKVFNFVISNYPEFAVYAYKGLSRLYVVYSFKYLLTKNLPKFRYCLSKSLIMMVKLPSSIGVNLIIICKEIFKRFCLLHATGSFFR